MLLRVPLLEHQQKVKKKEELLKPSQLLNELVSFDKQSRVGFGFESSLAGNDIASSMGNNTVTDRAPGVHFLAQYMCLQAIHSNHNLRDLILNCLWSQAAEREGGRGVRDGGYPATE